MKPLFAIGLIALYYFALIVPLRWLDKRLPDTPLKRFLFRERGRYRPARAAHADKRGLHYTALIGGESEKDRPRF